MTDSGEYELNFMELRQSQVDAVMLALVRIISIIRGDTHPRMLRVGRVILVEFAGDRQAKWGTLGIGDDRVLRIADDPKFSFTAALMEVTEIYVSSGGARISFKIQGNPAEFEVGEDAADWAQQLQQAASVIRTQTGQGPLVDAVVASPAAGALGPPPMPVEDIGEFILEHLTPHASNGLFLVPKLPEKKLANALKTYLKPEPGEAPLVLFDDTFFGSMVRTRLSLLPPA